MPHFTFKAKKGGEIIKGVQDAKDRFELYKMLKDSGEELISVKERGTFLSKFSANQSSVLGVSTHDKIIFARSLGSMIKAGLPVSHALSILERQTKSKLLKKIIGNLIEAISGGKMLSQALSRYPKTFSPLFISMVRSGEEGGTLTKSLATISLQMESSYTLQRRVRGAMIYPIIIFSIMIIITILMLLYIVPTLTKTFTELKVTLPASTRLVIGVSDLVRDHGLLVLVLVVIFATLSYMWFKRESGKKIFHGAILKIPIIGEIVKEVNSARTTRTLSSLMESGVDIVDALEITYDVVQNVHYKKIIKEAEEVIKKGEPMSKVFSNYSKFYPVFVAEMTAVGEETGKISEMLLNVAIFYEDDVAEKTKDMSTIIEPFLMVIIGLGVGFFALAMISPMYSLVNVI